MPSNSRRAGPHLSPETTRVIADSVFRELAARGFDGLSIDAVARRAGVGKAAIYRRWPGKREMIMALVVERATQARLFPDSGSLHDDLDELLTIVRDYLTDPLVARIVPDLLSVAARDASFARELYDRGGAARREHAVAMLRRAVQRGELPQGLDFELAADLVISPIYWRLSVTRRPYHDGDHERMIAMITAGLQALRAKQPSP